MENTYILCDSNIYQHWTFPAPPPVFLYQAPFRATPALLRATTLSYKEVTFVRWHFDFTFLSYTLFVMSIYILLYILPLNCVVCVYIVLIFIEYRNGIMNRLWTGWTKVQIPVWVRNFSLLQTAELRFWIGNGFFPRSKVAGSWSKPFTSTCCRGWEWWSYTSTYIHTYIFISFHRSIHCKTAFGYETCQKRKQTIQDIHKQTCKSKYKTDINQGMDKAIWEIQSNSALWPLHHYKPGNIQNIEFSDYKIASTWEHNILLIWKHLLLGCTVLKV